MYEFEDCLAIIFGMLTICIMMYRVIFIASPMAKLAFQKKSTPLFFKAVTLLI